MEHHKVVLEVTQPAVLNLLKLKASSHDQEKALSNSKPNICKMPGSSVFSRMNAFKPFLTGSTPSPDPQVGSVQFVAVSDCSSESSSDSSDSDTDEEIEDEMADSTKSGKHVEMRLALVHDEDDSNTDTSSEEEINEQSLRLPTDSIAKERAGITELK